MVLNYADLFQDLLEFSFQFNDFLNSGARNIVIETKLIRLYTRKSLRSFDGITFVECIDIANITIDERVRRRGICSGVIFYAEEACLNRNKFPVLYPISYPERATTKRGVFIESVLTQEFAESLIVRGYSPRDTQVDLFDHFVSVDLYKIIN